MAKVFLRVYNREIGSLIDQGQTEEAVGHCHHILKTFPKNLETYRLLGKAYLEAKRYTDATDIFSRVLTSVPDDFVAHVGMSMIVEKEEKLDEAIWHMERAFEAQSANAAVQSELQRLYGRRDGVEPPKVRMTSGALANVYMQGELYPQAIAEIMSVESRDPDRTDMQILLAKAYFRSGQRVEASQIASTLLAKYPYCLDANRILVEILPGTTRSESTPAYRHRVNALDPYAAFTKGSIFNTDDVPDASVSLERLDWTFDETLQLTSGWGDSMGIKLEPDSKEEQQQPESLGEGESTRDLEPDSTSQTFTEDKDIPEFMRVAGWGDSSGADEEPISFFDSPDLDPKPEIGSEEIEQGEMPDWMKAMAPSDEILSVDEVSNDNMADEIGDDMVFDEWINDLLGDSEDEDEKKKPEESLKNDTDVDAAAIGELGVSVEDQDAATSWLDSLATDSEAKAEETSPTEEVEDVSSWSQEEESEEPPTSTGETLISDPVIGKLGASVEDQDAAMGWLEGLAVNQGAKAEGLITDPDEREEDVPDWVQKAQEMSVDAKKAETDDTLSVFNEKDDNTKEKSTIEEAEGVSSWLQEEEEKEEPAAPKGETLNSDSIVGELDASVEDQDAAMSWLDSLAIDQEVKAEEKPTTEEAEGVLSWLQEEEEEPAVPRGEALNSDSVVGELDASVEDQDAAMSWLDSLAIDQEVKAEEKPIIEEAEDISTWLQKEEEKEELAAPRGETLNSDSVVGELDASVGDQDAAMSWLDSLAIDQEVKAEEKPIIEEVEDISTWLQKEEEKEETTTFEAAAEETLEPELLTGVGQDVETVEYDSFDRLNEMEAGTGEAGLSVSEPVEEKENDFPAWLAGMEGNETSKGQETKPDGDPLDWLEEEESTPQFKSTQTSEWQPAEIVSEAKSSPEMESKPVFETAPEKPLETKIVSEELSKSKKKENSKQMNTGLLRDISLMSAKTAMGEGNISVALEEYGKLIKGKRLLDGIIDDLREALDDHPVDVSIWQMLGDAYMGSGHLQEAINAYTNAENLMR